MKDKLVLLLILIGVISASITVIVYYSFFLVRVEHFIMDAKVIDRGFGLNGDSDAMHFGSFSPGAKVTKSINLTNNERYPALAKITIEGNISRFVAWPDSSIIPPKMTREINFTFTAPRTTGYYYGKATVYIKRG